MIWSTQYKYSRTYNKLHSNIPVNWLIIEKTVYFLVLQICKLITHWSDWLHVNLLRQPGVTKDTNRLFVQSYNWGVSKVVLFTFHRCSLPPLRGQSNKKYRTESAICTIKKTYIQLLKLWEFFSDLFVTDVSSWISMQQQFLNIEINEGFPMSFTSESFIP